MRNKRNSHRLTKTHVLITLASVALICFLAIAYARPYFDGVNSSVKDLAAGIQTQGATQVSKALDFFDTNVLLILTLPFAGVLLWKGSAENAGLLLGAMGIDALLLQRPKH